MFTLNIWTSYSMQLRYETMHSDDSVDLIAFLFLFLFLLLLLHSFCLTVCLILDNMQHEFFFFVIFLFLVLLHRGKQKPNDKQINNRCTDEWNLFDRHIKKREEGKTDEDIFRIDCFALHFCFVCICSIDWFTFIVYESLSMNIGESQEKHRIAPC
jgi:hypothetical protein